MKTWATWWLSFIHNTFLDHRILCLQVLLLETEVESISGNWQQGDEVPIGTSVNFGLCKDKVSGFKAMNARLYIQQKLKLNLKAILPMIVIVLDIAVNVIE